MSKKRILGVIGLGHVGAHAAYALAIQGIADELILVDKNAQKLASEVQDLRDAAAYLPHRVTVRAGDFPDLGACDVIINSVGKGAGAGPRPAARPRLRHRHGARHVPASQRPGPSDRHRP